jgi:hypothetical protein
LRFIEVDLIETQLIIGFHDLHNVKIETFNLHNNDIRRCRLSFHWQTQLPMGIIKIWWPDRSECGVEQVFRCEEYGDLVEPN